jgi:hypothetical protein
MKKTKKTLPFLTFVAQLQGQADVLRLHHLKRSIPLALRPRSPASPLGPSTGNLAEVLRLSLVRPAPSRPFRPNTARTRHPSPADTDRWDPRSSSTSVRIRVGLAPKSEPRAAPPFLWARMPRSGPDPFIKRCHLRYVPFVKPLPGSSRTATCQTLARQPASISAVTTSPPTRRLPGASQGEETV